MVDLVLLGLSVPIGSVSVRDFFRSPEFQGPPSTRDTDDPLRDHGRLTGS